MSGRAALPLALTMGEPAGVGAEATLNCWRNRRADATPPFFSIDNLQRLHALARRLGHSVVLREISDPSEAITVFDDALPVLPIDLNAEVVPGRLDPANAPAVQHSIERAVSLTQSGKAGAVVTNPIHKACLQQAGFSFPGHTEFLAHLAKLDTPPVMMLACSELRVVPVTIHMSLQAAIDTLTTEDIVTQALITAKALRRDFAINNPRLAIAGLNPHAGEDGAMGLEDRDIVAPAVLELKRQGIDAIGPLPSDTMFHARARKTYDAAICMYHDQALIPIKTIDFDHGVNVTLGLPFVRTSPDHGTALDIAGKGIAKYSSLLAALRMADQMVKSRGRDKA